MILPKTNAHAGRSVLCATLCALLLTVSFGTRAQSETAPSGSDPAQPLITDLPAAAAEQGVLGEPQLIEADVGTDEVLSRIDLFYRFDGEGRFRDEPMDATDVPGVYAASVPTRGVSAERLEFYIVAEDELGGTLVRGSAAEPLTRALVLPPGAVTSQAEASEGAGDGLFSGDNRRYLYYALGVLVVGAIAVAASDGGDDSSGEGCAPEGCQLTLTLPPPAP